MHVCMYVCMYVCLHLQQAYCCCCSGGAKGLLPHLIVVHLFCQLQSQNAIETTPRRTLCVCVCVCVWSRARDRQFDARIGLHWYHTDITITVKYACKQNIGEYSKLWCWSSHHSTPLCITWMGRPQLTRSQIVNTSVGRGWQLSSQLSSVQFWIVQNQSSPTCHHSQEFMNALIHDITTITSLMPLVVCYSTVFWISVSQSWQLSQYSYRHASQLALIWMALLFFNQ